MLKVTNNKEVSIRTQVDYESFVIAPGESILVHYDHRAERLKEVYPWLILEPYTPPQEAKVEEAEEKELAVYTDSNPMPKKKTKKKGKKKGY